MVIRLPAYGRQRTSLPTVRDVLEFPSLRRGDPVVVGGAAGLDRPVRWTHVSEILGIAELLRGGEMLLMTGMLLPDDTVALRDYVRRLGEANAAALVIGLGPRFRNDLPAVFTAEADRQQLPVVALRRTIAFIDVTEEVHASLVDSQVQELQASESIHRIFSSLAVQGSAQEIVLKQVAKLSGSAVVLADRDGRMLNFDPADRAASDVLQEWVEHSRRPTRAVRTFYDPQQGWLQTSVGARGNIWGRLVLMAPTAGQRGIDNGLDPTLTVPRTLIMLIEQAASTLAIGHLVDRESELLDLNAHGTMLGRILSGDADEEAAREAEALGLSLRRSPPAAFALRRRSDDLVLGAERRRRVRQLAAAVGEEARAFDPGAVVAPVGADSVGALIVPRHGRTGNEIAAALASRLESRGELVVMGVVEPQHGIRGVKDGLHTAIELVDTAVHLRLDGAVYGAGDLTVERLLHGLRDDTRVLQCAEDALARLELHDRQHDTAFVRLLGDFLESGRNKTRAARAAFVSRAWMHERLRVIGQILDRDLEDERVCFELQLALHIRRAVGARRSTDESGSGEAHG